MFYNLKFKINSKYVYILKFGDWGLGIGDCNPQSPIPNPQEL